MKKSSQQRIEEASLLLFSRQGFNETSTAEIALAASVSEASIYRLFQSKRNLYTHVLEKNGKKAILDYNSIFTKLTFYNINKDLEVIIDFCFDFYFKNIHITRIYISNAIQFSKLVNFDSLIFPQLKGFMENYLKEMNTRGFIDKEHIYPLTDVVISTIFQEVAFLTTFKKIEILDKKKKEELNQKWSKIIIELSTLYNWNNEIES